MIQIWMVSPTARCFRDSSYIHASVLVQVSIKIHRRLGGLKTSIDFSQLGGWKAADGGVGRPGVCGVASGAAHSGPCCMSSCGGRRALRSPSPWRALTHRDQSPPDDPASQSRPTGEAVFTAGALEGRSPSAPGSGIRAATQRRPLGQECCPFLFSLCFPLAFVWTVCIDTVRLHVGIQTQEEAQSWLGCAIHFSSLCVPLPLWHWTYGSFP